MITSTLTQDSFEMRLRLIALILKFTKLLSDTELFGNLDSIVGNEGAEERWLPHENTKGTIYNTDHHRSQFITTNDFIIFICMHWIKTVVAAIHFTDNLFSLIFATNVGFYFICIAINNLLRRIAANSDREESSTTTTSNSSTYARNKDTINETECFIITNINQKIN